MLIDIGPARDDEMGFVLSSYKEASVDAAVQEMAEGLSRTLPCLFGQPMSFAVHIARGCEGRLFHHFNETADAILRSSPLILVAREKDDPSFAYGWVAVGHVEGVFALYYTYVKRHYRRYGVMAQLMARALEFVPVNAEPVFCTRSPRDEVFEGAFGLEYRPLRDVLQQQRKTA